MPDNYMSVLCQETDLPDFLLSNSSLTLLSIFAQPFVLVYVKYIDSSWALQLPNLIELNFLFDNIFRLFKRMHSDPSCSSHYNSKVTE